GESGWTRRAARSRPTQIAPGEVARPSLPGGTVTARIGFRFACGHGTRALAAVPSPDQRPNAVDPASQPVAGSLKVALPWAVNPGAATLFHPAPVKTSTKSSSRASATSPSAAWNVASGTAAGGGASRTPVHPELAMISDRPHHASRVASFTPS